jgi:cytoskeletal protein RodZ
MTDRCVGARATRGVDAVHLLALVVAGVTLFLGLMGGVTVAALAADGDPTPPPTTVTDVVEESPPPPDPDPAPTPSAKVKPQAARPQPSAHATVSRAATPPRHEAKPARTRATIVRSRARPSVKPSRRARVKASTPGRARVHASPPAQRTVVHSHPFRDPAVAIRSASPRRAELVPAPVVSSAASGESGIGAAVLLIVMGLGLVAMALVSPSPFVSRGALARIADERGELFAGGVALLIGLLVAVVLSAVG